MMPLDDAGSREDPDDRTAMAATVQRLAAIVRLTERVRRATPAELPFIAVNETLQVVSYSQAALWDARKKRVTALSGVPSVDGASPYARRVASLMSGAIVTGDPVRADADLGDQGALKVLHSPMPSPDGSVGYVLSLFRPQEWGDADVEIVGVVAGQYASAFALASWKRPRRAWAGSKVRSAALVLGAVAVVALGALPIRSNVLAPAEVVPEHPVVIRAPYGGVVDSVTVAFNAAVKMGDVLVHMDRRQADTQRDAARKAVEAARLEVDEATQEGMSDPRARGRVGVLKARLEEQEAELAYRETQISRSDVRATASGVAVIGDPMEWGGRPVEAGERIMMVSPPSSDTIEITVPASDAVTFDIGASVMFFDNLRPDHPVHGTVVFSSYGTSPDPDGVLSYRLRARLETGASVRMGTRGTAKVFGAQRSVAGWILRKPMNAVRAWVSGMA